VVFEDATIIFLLLLLPLIISFIIYLVASAFGATPLPGVGYGVQCVSNSGGVCTLWTVPASGSTSATNVTLPTVLINALNSLLILISVGGALFAAVKMGPKMWAARGREE
jgi:hypothetical protein